MSLLAVVSAVAKLRHDRHVVHVINEVVGVPMKWLPWLGACEIAGAAGLLIGLAWPPLGMAAGTGLVVYFLGAIVAHLRVGDLEGIGTPAVPFALAIACLVMRILSA
jgi:hypothetical protein